MKKDKGNRMTIADLPKAPDVQTAPRGVIVTPEERAQNEASEQAVEDIREWNEENKL